MNLSPTHDWPANDRAAADRRALTRLKIIAFATTGICVMALVITAVGLLPLLEVSVVTAYCVVGNLLFYALVKSGLAARFGDPSCIFPHHLFTISILLLGCALLPQDRIASLQIFLLICAFDVPFLSSRQLSIAALITIGGVLATVLMDARIDREALYNSLLALAMALVYLPALVGICHVVRKVRGRQLSQRTALADALAQLRRLSELDMLTGASNRRHALGVLAKEVALHGRTGRTFAIGLLDLDLFKQINDTHGHAVGDEVLIDTVRRVRETLRAQFTVARWGGEEFLVVMPETTSAEAAECMRQARAGIVSNDWSRCARGLRVDASVGVCEHRPGESIEATLDRADRALYQAKAEGRGRVVEQSL